MYFNKAKFLANIKCLRTKSNWILNYSVVPRDREKLVPMHVSRKKPWYCRKAVYFLLH